MFASGKRPKAVVVSSSTILAVWNDTIPDDIKQSSGETPANLSHIRGLKIKVDESLPLYGFRIQ
jgi:hypothetical protein